MVNEFVNQVMKIQDEINKYAQTINPYKAFFPGNILSDVLKESKKELEVINTLTKYDELVLGWVVAELELEVSHNEKNPNMIRNIGILPFILLFTFIGLIAYKYYGSSSEGLILLSALFVLLVFFSIKEVTGLASESRTKRCIFLLKQAIKLQKYDAKEAKGVKDAS